jgi:hypothetical protein
MKFFSLIIIIMIQAVYANCHNANDTDQKIFSMKDNQNKTIDSSKIKKLIFSKAISQYKNPLKKVKFTLSDNLSEFRISLYNHFSKDQIKTNKIMIVEVTWKLNNNENVTAWYLADKDQKPISVLIWDKDAEF